MVIYQTKLERFYFLQYCFRLISQFLLSSQLLYFLFGLNAGLIEKQKYEISFVGFLQSINPNSAWKLEGGGLILSALSLEGKRLNVYE